MKFFVFRQNNSGGDFDVNDKLCHKLIIQAKSATEANRIAKRLGCYWDGVDRGIDCECCGDRWWRVGSNFDLDEINQDGVSVKEYDHKYGVYEYPYCY